MGELETKLLMTFSTTSARKVSLFITDPRQDLTESEIKAAMDIIVQKNIFAPRFGEELQAPLEAKVVQTETTEYDLVVS